MPRRLADPRSLERMSVWRIPGMWPLVLLTVAGFGGFSALVSVAPLWVVRGGANEVGAGLVTTTLLVVTVAVQAVVPWALGRFGHAAVISVGLAALGLPSLALGLSDELLPVLALSGVRGIGFAVITVTGAAVVAEIVPPFRRGEGIGVYGLAVALPNLAILPLSVTVAVEVGFWWVFVAGALPLAGIPAAFVLGRVLRERSSAAAAAAAGAAAGETRDGRATARAPGAATMAPRTALRRVVAPSLVLLSVTLAGGGLITFLPQMVESAALSSAALFAVGATAALSRWLVGRIGDRRGAGGLLTPLLVATAASLLLLAVAIGRSGWLWALLPAVAVFGVGYGALQNLTLVAAFARVDALRYGVASAVWNIGFDAGTGLGAVLLGVLAAGASFTSGVMVLAGLVLVAVPVALPLRHVARVHQPGG